MVKVGDTVMYKDDDGVPPMTKVPRHPAIITHINTVSSVDLIVFYHGHTGVPVMDVHSGHEGKETACWWERR